MSQSANVTTSGPDDQTQVLSVQGELDLATADSLYQRGRAAIGCGGQLLLLDLTDLSFCDACGLSALVRIANEAEAAGCRYGLVASRTALGRHRAADGRLHRTGRHRNR